MELLMNAFTLFVLILFTAALFTLLAAAVGIDIRQRRRDKEHPADRVPENTPQG
jgi:hypothetical protein